MAHRIVAAAVATVLALVAAGAVWLYVRSADSRALAGQQVAKAYIADDVVPAGTTWEDAIDAGLIRPELVSLKGVPAGAMQDATARGDLMAVSDIAAGEIVLATRFSQDVAVAGRLAVPSGKLAVSVELTDPAKVGQFLVVGSRITVFDTFNVQEGDPDDVTPAGDELSSDHAYTRATRVLLPDVEVLAVGQTTTKEVATTSGAGVQAAAQQQPEATQTQTVTLVTLAVDQAQAQALVHGIQTGTLYFALRSADVEIVPGRGVTDRGLFEVTAP
jgi:pilus assembly protein CpaB